MPSRLRRLLLIAALALVALPVPAAHAVWGGEYRTASGETVRIFSSDLYARDDAAHQSWAEFLTTLVHGPELASVTVIFLTGDEISRRCGVFALACYSSASARIYTPREDDPGGLSARAILAHEYGHHVARSRFNPPWRAIDRGTKRWSSYLGICARSQSGQLGGAYETDPAEVFAESYRVLAELRTGQTPSPWLVVSPSLYPDETALGLLEQDILEPWVANTRTTFRSAFRRGSRARVSFTVTTPYDGAFAVRVIAPTAANFRVAVYDSGGRLLARAAPGSRIVRGTVCGQRSLVVRVERVRGFGSFTVTASKP